MPGWGHRTSRFDGLARQAGDPTGQCFGSSAQAPTSLRRTVGIGIRIALGRPCVVQARLRLLACVPVACELDLPPRCATEYAARTPDQSGLPEFAAITGSKLPTCRLTYCRHFPVPISRMLVMQRIRMCLGRARNAHFTGRRRRSPLSL